MNSNSLFIALFDILHIGTIILATVCIIKRKVMVTSIISIIITLVSFIGTFIFSMHRNWAQVIPESELNFFLNELSSWNINAIFLCVQYVILIVLFLYNGRMLQRKEKE